MDDLRKQVLLDLCVTPWTLFPAGIGATLLLLSFGGLGGGFAFGGFMCCLFALGALATNFMFNLNAVTERAYDRYRKKQESLKNSELDELDARLAKTKGKNDETALRNLRALYAAFAADVKDKKISDQVPTSMIDQIDEIFDACIHNLRSSVGLYDQARSVTGSLKKTLNDQRDQVLVKVEGGIETLSSVINEVRALGLNSDIRSLEGIQNRLSSQLDIAKATEEAVVQMERELEGGDLDKYAEYETN